MYIYIESLRESLRVKPKWFMSCSVLTEAAKVAARTKVRMAGQGLYQIPGRIEGKYLTLTNPWGSDMIGAMVLYLETLRLGDSLPSLGVDGGTDGDADGGANGGADGTIGRTECELHLKLIVLKSSQG